MQVRHRHRPVAARRRTGRPPLAGGPDVARRRLEAHSRLVGFGSARRAHRATEKHQDDRLEQGGHGRHRLQYGDRVGLENVSRECRGNDDIAEQRANGCERRRQYQYQYQYQWRCEHHW